jgi:hypothetical protein
MRIAALLGVVALAVLPASVRATSTPPRPTVPCDDVIGQASSPHEGGYRLVLGVVSVPPAHLRRVVRLPGQRWPYWRKAGLVVRAGRVAITVSVPKEWRSRLAITWGTSTSVVSSLRIAACPSPPNVWNAYAGGFYLRSRAACVPLVFRVGQRRATVRFGVGRSCATASSR